MASIREHTASDGKKTHQLLYRLGGKQHSVTFVDRRSAETWQTTFNTHGAATGLAMLQASLDATVDDLTVRDAMSAYVDSLTGITPGTRADYHREAERDVFPMLGDLPVTALTEDVVAGWVNHLERQGLSGKTIKNRHALLSAMCKRLVMKHALPTNPAYGMRLPRTDTAEMVVLTPAEWARLLHEIRPDHHDFFVTLVALFPRLSELTALQVADVYTEAPDAVTVRIHQAWKHGPGTPTLGPPKTKAGKRTLHIPQGTPVAHILAERCEGRPSSEFVFVGARGGNLHGGGLYSRVWRPAVERFIAAGGRGLRIHDLRHTGISWALAAGVPLLDVAHDAGHDDPTMTAKRYGHVMPSNRGMSFAATSLALSQSVPEIEG